MITKYYENDNGVLWQGDCLEVMDLLQVLHGDSFVDAVICDPPYNIAKDNNFTTMGRAGIDFGEWDKGFDLFSYIDKVFKLTEKDGSFVVFNDWKNLGDISKYAEKLGFMTKDMIRLEKSNPMPRNRDRRYITDFECAIWFTMPKAKWVFNRQNEKYERPRFVGSIEKGMHPTQKNLGLMEWLIKIHTNEQQTILDPFAGSGTTLVACQNTGRKFIGIEREEKYCEIAKQRLEGSI